MPATNLQAAMRDVEHIRQKCTAGQVGPTFPSYLRVKIMLSDQRKLLVAISLLSKMIGELVVDHKQGLDKIGKLAQGKEWDAKDWGGIE